MSDPREHKLQITRQRSKAATRYTFEFFDNNRRAVFPILKRDNDGIASLSGTGFFIAPGGVFGTAKHLFEGRDVAETDFFVILQEGDDHICERDIIDVVIDSDSDLAIGLLDSPPDGCQHCEDHPVVGIMRLDPQIRELVGCCFFSHTLLDHPEHIKTENGLELFQKIRYRSHWEIGLVESIHPDGLGLAKGYCFGTSIFSEGGGSGGPVFNSNGFVIAVHSRGFAEQEGLPHSTSTSIRNLLKLEIGSVSINKRRKEINNSRIAVRRALI